MGVKGPIDFVGVIVIGVLFVLLALLVRRGGQERNYSSLNSPFCSGVPIWVQKPPRGVPSFR